MDRQHQLLMCPESNIHYDVIPSIDFPLDFRIIKEEIVFQQVTNQGHPIPRLIAIQGTILSNGNMHVSGASEQMDDVLLKPIYRHPMDFQPDVVSWTPSVLAVKNYLSNKFNQDLNHCLIQLYRDGQDSIGEHADKTLDIKWNSSIINYSIGATRVMHLRLKERGEDRKLVKVPLKHNSAYVLDWCTNQLYLHGIRPDKRPEQEKTIDEKAYHGERISFTFRTIDTFIDSNNKLYGQGARRVSSSSSLSLQTHPSLDSPSPKQPQQQEQLLFEESLSLMKAFSLENNSSTLEWHDIYGEGYQVINFQTLNDRSNDRSNDRTADNMVASSVTT